tara:strand:+ start:818 stop:1297 length:480 start_codon:yes stop_codon:yes gene_type:complete
MNKKGEGYNVATKTISWMIMGGILTMAVLALAIILSVYQSAAFSVPGELRANAISQRFVNTPECFTYQDSETGRVYPGVIEIEKFTQARMDNCYRTEESMDGYDEINFGVFLEGFEGQVVLESNNYKNKVDYTFYENVLVKSGEEYVPTRMVIYVQENI